MLDKYIFKQFDWFTLLLVLCVCYVVAATNATALYANF